MEILLRVRSFDEITAVTDAVGEAELEIEGKLWLKINAAKCEDKIVKYVQLYTDYDYKTALVITRLVLALNKKCGINFLDGNSIKKYVAGEISSGEFDEKILSRAVVNGVQYGLFLNE